jgi:hypothetical protein
VPYDSTPVGPDVDADGRRQTLTLHIEGSASSPDRVLVLERPRAGMVPVREQVIPGGTRAYEATPAELIAEVDGALREGRRVSVEPYLLRQWCAGRA